MSAEDCDQEIMTGKERMITILRGGIPDVCPAAPVFWGEEYIWKITGRTLLDQMLGPDPGWCQAADCLIRRHRPDWFLLTVGDGNGWLVGKEVVPQRDRVLIRDPQSGKEYEFLWAGRVLRQRGAETQPHAAQGMSGAQTREQVRALFHVPDVPSATPSPRVQRLVADHGNEVFICDSVISPFVDACYRLGAQQAMVLLADDPDLFAYAAELSLEITRAQVQGIAAGGVHGVLIAESYASCDMISPEQYRRFAFPFQKALVDAIHAHGLFAILFSTGNLMPILEPMQRLEADGLIVEESRKGAEIEIGEVRRRYGAGRGLWGNVAAETLLRQGELGEIRREVARQIDTAGRAGAFAVSNGASPVCDETPPQAVDALIDAAHAYHYV